MTGIRFSSLKSLLLIFLLALVSIFLQATLLPSFLPPILVPNFMLVLLVFLSFYAVNVSGAFVVFFLGILLDMFSGILIGPWAASFMVVFIGISLLSQRLFVETFVASSLAVFFGTLFCSLVYKTITFGLAFEGQSIVFFLVQGLIAAVLAPVLFQLLRSILLRKELGMAGRPASLF